MGDKMENNVIDEAKIEEFIFSVLLDELYK